jgi:hypothetical protein
MDLREGQEDFAVRGAEGAAVDRAGRDHRGRHVPVTQHHAEAGVSLIADQSH